MLDTDAAYMAGIIDGEGCITISKSINTRLLHGESVYQGMVSVTNTDRRMLEHLIKITGVGSIYTERVSGTRKKTPYRWQCRSQNALFVLRAAYPHLVTKGKQAAVVIEMIEETSRGRKGFRVTSESLDYRDLLYRIIRRHHAR